MILEHLFSVWPDIIHQLKNSRHVLFLTDYDGTLTDIVERPEDAHLSDEMRNLLQGLSHQSHFTVGVISGRGLKDIRNKVQIKNIIYAGNHGFEITGPGIDFINPGAEEMKSLLCIIQQTLTETLGKIKGIIIENKGLTLAIHYRMVEQNNIKIIDDTINNIIKKIGSSGKIKMNIGKKVYEIKPDVDWDKGQAIRLLMQKYDNGDQNNVLFPVYLGDDSTDEDAFIEINKYPHGISVSVSKEGQNSAAKYYLRSPSEVAVFLKLLLEQAQRGFNG